MSDLFVVIFKAIGYLTLPYIVAFGFCWLIQMISADSMWIQLVGASVLYVMVALYIDIHVMRLMREAGFMWMFSAVPMHFIGSASPMLFVFVVSKDSGLFGKLSAIGKLVFLAVPLVSCLAYAKGFLDFMKGGT